MNPENGRAARLFAALSLAVALAAAACDNGSMSPQSSDSGADSGGTGGGTGGSTFTSACTPASDSGGPYCLTFKGTAYSVHIGQTFKVALVLADGSNTVVTGATVAALPGASFTVDLPRAMAAGVPYYVDYYADNNRDGTCTTPALAGDHVWRSHTVQDFYHGTVTTVTALNGDVTFSAPHDDPFVTDPTGMDTCPQLNQLP